MDEFRRTLSKSLGMVFLLTLPSSVGLIVLGKSIIGAIYQGGKFQLYDTQQTALALSCYAIGLAGYAALKVLTPAFYALGDARTPMLVSLASIVINYAAASTMIRVAGLRPRGAGAVDLGGRAVRIRGPVRDFAQSHRRSARARAGGAIGKGGAASLAMGAVVGAVQPRHGTPGWGFRRLARLADLGGVDSAGARRLLRDVPRAGRERYGYGGSGLHGAAAPPVRRKEASVNMRSLALAVGFAVSLALSLCAQSIDELTNQIAHQPTSALYAARAAEQLRLGHAQLAVDDYSQAIRFRLDDPAPWIGRAKAFIALGRFSDAIDNLDQAIRLDPGPVAPYVERGYAYGQMGDFPSAIKDFDQVIRQDPKNLRALSLRGAAWARLNHPEKALPDREAVVRLSPDSAEAYVARGGSYHELGMHDKGLADRTEAIRLKPDMVEAWYARGSAYFLLGRYREAIDDLNRVLELKPDHAAAQSVLAQARQAVAKLEKPAEVAPVEVAVVEVSKAEPAPAPVPLREPVPEPVIAAPPAPTAPVIDPKAAALHNQRGRDLLNQGKYAAAIEELNSALAAQPDLALAFNARGFAYYLLRDYPHALADFDAAIQLNPKYRTRCKTGSWPATPPAARKNQLNRKQLLKPGALQTPPHEKRAEQRIDGAHLVEPHLVNQPLEHQRIVGEQIHAPFPVVETDGAGDDLFHSARIAPADGPVLLHHELAVLERHLIPVLLLAATPVHGVKAQVLGGGNFGKEPRVHGRSLALQRFFNSGVPLRRVRLQTLFRQRSVRLGSGFVQPQLHHGKIGRSLLQIIPQAQTRQRGCTSPSSSKDCRKCTSIKSPLWPSSENAALRHGSKAASSPAACSRISVRTGGIERAPGCPADPQHLMQYGRAFERQGNGRRFVERMHD